MPTPTYDLIGSTTLGTAATNISFTSIPNSYKDLIVIFDTTKATAGADSLNFRLNNDSSSIYNGVIMEANGSLTNARLYSNSGDGVMNWNYSIVNSTTRGLAILQLMDYSATDKHKTILARSGSSSTAIAAAAVRYATTSAISSIQFFTGGGSTLAIGTSIYIYGIVS